MQIFVSWSKNRPVAEVVAEWIQQVNQKLSAYISSEMAKGIAWDQNLTSALSDCRAGLVCLSHSNHQEPWIQFEAGALSNAYEKSRVFTMLFDLESRALIDNPLSRFQDTKFNRVDALKLTRSINELMGDEKVNDRYLTSAFDKHWADFEKQIKDALTFGSAAVETRPTDPTLNAINELLSLSNSQMRALATLEKKMGELLPSSVKGIAQHRLSKLFFDITEFLQLATQEIENAQTALGYGDDPDDIVRRLRRINAASKKLIPALSTLAELSASDSAVTSAFMATRMSLNIIRTPSE